MLCAKTTGRMRIRFSVGRLGGAELHDLGALAQEIANGPAPGPTATTAASMTGLCGPDTTIGGAGRVQRGSDSGVRRRADRGAGRSPAQAGPEDARTLLQRRHDALEEACQRLIAARMLPGRDGQPVHVQVHVDLAALRGLPGGPGAPAWKRASAPARKRASALARKPAEPPGAVERRSRVEPRPGGRVEPRPGSRWSPARAAADTGSVYLSGAGAEAAACDATVTPVVAGRLDWTTLDQLTTLFAQAHGRGPDHHRDRRQSPAAAGTTAGTGTAGAGTAGTRTPSGTGRDLPRVRLRLRDTLLDMSITLLSGPAVSRPACAPPPRRAVQLP